MSLTRQLPGYEMQTTCGSCYIIQKHYPAGHQHGHDRLDRWLHAPIETANPIQRDTRWLNLRPIDCLFLDIETTGLGGSDIVAFMVGVGFFTEKGFELRQYFLREEEEETAQLEALGELLDSHPALITFNGRKFDIPVLHERYRVNGMSRPLNYMPNLDLLLLARQLWQRRLPSRRLGALETDVLGVTRSTEDVDGRFIPGMYYEYLNTGDLTPIQQIAYHNEIDVLSMVTLGTMLLQTFAEPDCDTLPLDDVICLGIWYTRLRMFPEAERVYEAALNRANSLEEQRDLLEKLSTLLAKTDPYHAVNLWQQWSSLDPDNPAPLLELSKYYEGESRDWQAALETALTAQQIYETHPPTPGKALHLSALQNRIKRLQKKVARA